jgi:F-type H+-transporting ATPase subunit b
VSRLELLFSAQLWAASSAEAEKHAASITQLVFPLINFLIFLYLVKRFLLPLARDYFRSRREEILSAVQGADEEKRQAEERLRDYQKRLSRLASEATEIQAASRAEGERQRAKLIAEARDLAAKIKADAGFLADQEAKIARQQVQAEIARLAQEAAQKVLQRHLTPGDQKRLVEEFLTELGGAG